MAAQGTDKEAAWVGGRDFIPHTNPQELTTAPTMMHDEIALPALRLILGDYSGANFKATNTLRKACSRSGLHADVYAEAARLFDAIVATQLAQTPQGKALLETITRIQNYNAQYKGRMLGSIIRDMAGREGGFTASLTPSAEWDSLSVEQRQRHIPFPLNQDQCADKQGAASLTLLTLLPPIVHSKAFVAAVKAMTGVDISTPGTMSLGGPGGGPPVASTLTLDPASVTQLTQGADAQASVARQAMNSTPAAQTQISKLKRTDPEKVDLALSEPAIQKDMQTGLEAVAAHGDTVARAKAQTSVATAILQKSTGGDPHTKAVAQAIYIGNTTGTKPQHDGYVAHLNQIAQALALDITTSISKHLPFGHNKDMKTITSNLMLMKEEFFKRDNHKILLGHEKATGAPYTLRDIHGVKVVTTQMEDILIKLGWEFAGTSDMLVAEVENIQADDGVSDTAVIFDKFVTPFYRHYAMLISDKTHGYFHQPVAKPDPKDLLKYKTREKLRAVEHTM